MIIKLAEEGKGETKKREEERSYPRKNYRQLHMSEQVVYVFTVW